LLALFNNPPEFIDVVSELLNTIKITPAASKIPIYINFEGFFVVDDCLSEKNR